MTYKLYTGKEKSTLYYLNPYLGEDNSDKYLEITSVSYESSYLYKGEPKNMRVPSKKEAKENYKSDEYAYKNRIFYHTGNETKLKALLTNSNSTNSQSLSSIIGSSDTAINMIEENTSIYDLMTEEEKQTSLIQEAMNALKEENTAFNENLEKEIEATNSELDRLAKEALESINLDEYALYTGVEEEPLYFKVKNEFKLITLDKYKTEWNTTYKGKIYYNVIKSEQNRINKIVNQDLANAKNLADEKLKEQSDLINNQNNTNEKINILKKLQSSLNETQQELFEAKINYNIKEELFSTTNGLLDIVKMETLSDIQKTILPNIEYYKVRRILSPLVEKNNPIIIEKLKKVLANYTLEIFNKLLETEKKTLKKILSDMDECLNEIEENKWEENYEYDTNYEFQDQIKRNSFYKFVSSDLKNILTRGNLEYDRDFYIYNLKLDPTTFEEGYKCIYNIAIFLDVYYTEAEYRQMLINWIISTNPSNNYNEILKFIELDYNEKNFNSVINSIPEHKKHDFERIVVKDPYWYSKKEDILKKKFNYIPTKYYRVESELDIVMSSSKFSYLLNYLKNIFIAMENE